MDLLLTLVFGFGAMIAAGALFQGPRSSPSEQFRIALGAAPEPTKYERRWRAIALWGMLLFCIWGLSKLGAFGY